MHIALYQPEIPPNTGNVIRLCVNVGARLHLIEPLGFTLHDGRLRRAGLDYTERAVIETWPDLETWRAEVAPSRVLALSTRGATRYDRCRFHTDDAILFGPETRGLPDEVLASVPTQQRLYIPMRHGNRSVNLSNSVAIVAYEAWRQASFE